MFTSTATGTVTAIITTRCHHGRSNKNAKATPRATKAISIRRPAQASATFSPSCTHAPSRKNRSVMVLPSFITDTFESDA